MANANGEERKFIVMPAYSRVGGAIPAKPNYMSQIDPAYFDHSNDSVNSFAEYWEEISHGEVTIDGTTFSWVDLPWPIVYYEVENNDDPVYPSRIPHVNLNDCSKCQMFSGETFVNGVEMYQWDLDGDGGLDPFWITSLAGEDVDVLGNPVWSPGERFRDVNGNGIYDALCEVTADGFGSAIDPNDGSCVGADGIIEEGEFCDYDGDGVFDYPEPFEDFLWIRDPDLPSSTFPWRLCHPASPDWSWCEEYIDNNYPGDAQAIKDRCGNGVYDGPDYWNESGYTSKLKYAGPRSSSPTECPEPTTTGTIVNAVVDYSTWWDHYWKDAHRHLGLPVSPAPAAPDWYTGIPQFVEVDEETDIGKPFRPNAGGLDARTGIAGCIPDPSITDPTLCILIDPPDPESIGTGIEEAGEDGLIYPDATGYFDGVAEFQDLPSSIYHTRSWGVTWSGYDYVSGTWYGGDGRPGEVTSPQSRYSYHGQDFGDGDPNTSESSDNKIVAAGPFAYNVHGSGGYDAGNQLNIEFLTWRYKAPADAAMKRDYNLDGLMDLGEIRLPGTENYARDTYLDYPSDKNDGGPGENYPFNRQRLVEDIVAAMDSTTDWDTWVMPCDHPDVGFAIDSDNDGMDDVFFTEKNFVSSTFILPEGLFPTRMADGGRGLFQLPAPAMDLPIQIKEDAGGALSPLWFSDFGFAMGDVGESGLYNTDYGVQLMEHEFLHVWEGYPDLYDYDVYIGGDVDYPVEDWDIMASGAGHPSPPLKEGGGKSTAIPCLRHDPWIELTDLTTVLQPWAETEVTMKDYAFDPVDGAFYYENPNVFGTATAGNVERFYFWRVTDTVPDEQIPNMVNFNRALPNDGVLIMHTDVDANPEGFPDQQRVGDHQSYYIVQADGNYDMDGMVNRGDAGDTWPGSTNKTEWWEDRGSPVSEWWDTSYSGLEIVDIDEEQDQSTVTFKWTPRLVPELSFIDPPGGEAVNGNYKIRYRASDFQGGTTIEFFYDTDDGGYDGTSINPGGFRKENPFIVDGIQLFPIPGDGVYWIYAKLTPGVGNDGTTELSFSPVNPMPENTGSARFIDPNTGLEGIGVDLDKSKVEYWTVTCINDETPDAEEWLVAGLVGEDIYIETATAVTSRPFTSADGEVKFTIQWNGEVLTNATVGPNGSAYELVDPAGDFINRGLSYGDTIRITSGPKTGFFTVIAVRNATTLRLRENPGTGAVSEYRLFSLTAGDQNRAPDTFTFFTTGKTEYSVPVQFQNGAVVPTLYPTLTYSYDGDQDVLPVTVSFDATGTRDELWAHNENIEYTWDFGDGNVYTPSTCQSDTGSRSCPTVSHTYETAFPTGAQVTLTAVNPASLVEGLETAVVAVGEPDSDLDTIPDDDDNCPSTANTDQADADGDDTGDLCDGCPSDPLKVAPGDCGCGLIEFASSPTCGKDCNLNGVQDALDISTAASTDCNANGIPDECDAPDDCNSNGVNDVCDIFFGGMNDCNNNWIPDECESTEDCNGNGDMDICDIATGASQDCNFNDVPDECDIADGVSVDTHGDGIPDECQKDCNTNGIPDNAELAASTAQDCNNNLVPDDCDIADGTSNDCNNNGIPDKCDLASGASTDCDGNLIPDDCDTFYDCNLNSVRDICDIVGTTSSDCDNDQTPDECETDTDGDGTIDDCDGCPEDSNKTNPGVAGCGFAETDSDNDGTPNVTDQCPQDPNKYVPGVCGCGIKDVDTEVPSDGVYDCIDVCLGGHDKLDDDDDGVPDFCDECPSDPNKSEPGQCGCGTSDADSDDDGEADCNDNCKLVENEDQADADQDGTGDVCDACPNDPDKTAPGECGCGVADDDTDNDAIPDCNDNCPDNRNVNQADGDEDGTGDVCDGCPDNSSKADPGVCGCDTPDTDSDGDTVPDCIDECPATDAGVAVDSNGCESGDEEPGQTLPDDADGDGVADDDDLCPNTPDGADVNSNGCSQDQLDDDTTPNACGTGAAPCGATGMFGMWLTLCGLGWLKGSRTYRRRR